MKRIMTTFEIVLSVISVLAAVGIFSGLYKIGNKIGGFEKSINNLELSMKKLPCEQHGESLRKLHDDVLAIKIFLTSKYKNAEAIWGVKQSPTMLNENGITLFKNINGAVFLYTNKDFLIEKINMKKPKTPLDVEIDAHEVLIENTDGEMFNALKNWVYDSPAVQIKDGDMAKNYTVSLFDVCYVLSIPLRDVYLELYPNLFPVKVCV